MDPLYLGFDSSTQSLKAIALDAKLKAVAIESVNFASTFPRYKTVDGVNRDPSGNGRITGPVLMYVEAMGCLLNKLQSNGFPFEKVVAVSGSAQQYGSVYWREGSGKVLRNLNSSRTLVSQLENAFATTDCPLWMDSSTASQCREIETAMGGAETLCRLTGSRAYKHCTGPQIRKMFQTQEDVYNNTERISLISSFAASLLTGGYASIDTSDGAAMNLMDLKQKTWSPAALEATAPNLEERLGSLAPSHTVAGEIHPFFVKRYNFNPDAVVVHWSGDNLGSLAGLGLEKPGDWAMSLGTGTTVFGVAKDPVTSLDGCVFPNAVDPETYMCMMVYRNASLTRQWIRDRVADRSWDTFDELLRKSHPLNEGKIGFYYNETEILPPLPAGFHRYILQADGKAQAMKATEFDAASEVRALVEGQVLAIKSHAKGCGLPDPHRIICTGGSSVNRNLLRVLGDVFGVDIYTSKIPESAALGGALRAGHGYHAQFDANFTFSSLLGMASEHSAATLNLAVRGGEARLRDAYEVQAERRLQIEKQLLSQAQTKI